MKHLLRLEKFFFFFFDDGVVEDNKGKKHARRKVWVRPVFQQEAGRAQDQYQNHVRELVWAIENIFSGKRD